MKVIRIGSAVLLLALGIGGLVQGTAAITTSHDPSLLVSALFYLGYAWLIWKRAEGRKFAAWLLIVIGAAGIAFELEGVAVGKSPPMDMVWRFVVISGPALALGGLLWRGASLRQLGAVALVFYAITFTLETLVKDRSAVSMVVAIIRFAAPALGWSWLLLSGGDVRRIGAVLLMATGASYVIESATFESAGYLRSGAWGGLLYGLPVLGVGMMLWRNPVAQPRSLTVVGAVARGDA